MSGLLKGAIVGPVRAVEIGWSVRSTEPIDFSIAEVRGVFRSDNPTLIELMRVPHAAPRAMVFVDQTVLSLHKTAITEYFRRNDCAARIEAIPGGESAKSQRRLCHILNLFCEFGLERKGSPVVAIGGGTVLDVVGFAASIYRRGVPYIRIPTTLMAQIDGGIGVKTAINWNNLKNRVGAYAPPAHVLIDYDLLRTLPQRQINNGVAEIIKVAICRSGELFCYVEQHLECVHEAGWGCARSLHMFRAAIENMLDELQPNLFEIETSRLVDFGHWISPLIELGPGNLLHGEAVAVDMAISCASATVRGLLKPTELPEKIVSLIKRAGLPLLCGGCTRDTIGRALVEVVRHRGGRQRIPLPTRPGACVFVDDLTVDEVLEGVHLVRRWCEAASRGRRAPPDVARRRGRTGSRR